ncbi:MAG: hypothetical protein R2717_06755 [Schumannella sp.]
MAATTTRRGSRTRDERARGVIEVVTAVLLGLVSVATAAGAYQASQWSQQAGDLASISQQARDRNLSLYLETEIVSGDDFQRLFDAIALYAEMSFYPERTEELEAEQDLIVAAASQPLAEGFAAWREAGYPLDAVPFNTPEYESLTYAPSQSYNQVSALAYRSSQALDERAYTMTIVSVIFAVALLLLGVASATASLRVMALTAGGGAVAFLVGVATVIFGVY